MGALLLGHAVEHRRRARILVAQPRGELGIDQPVLLLGTDGEGQDLAPVERGEIALVGMEQPAQHRKIVRID